MCWCVPTVQELGRWKPENQKFTFSVSYIVDHGQTGIWVSVILSRKNWKGEEVGGGEGEEEERKADVKRGGQERGGEGR